MCTIVLLVGAHPRFPLLVAANRDEFHARAAHGPRVLVEATRAVGGQDVQAGGTWMGVTANGLFAGLTNQRTWHAPAPGLRSRGEVPLGVLACRSVDEAHDYVRGLDGRDYNEFNLVYGDATRLYCAYARRDARALRIAAVPAGAHVLSNDVLDAPTLPKAGRAQREAMRLARAAADAPTEDETRIFSGLSGLLASHERAPLAQVQEPPAGSALSRELAQELDALCVHAPGYGTRSATLIALAPGRVAQYLFAPGPPCTTPFDDHTALLQR
jgi:uncharacterized protein with NRDE domain